MNTVDKIVNDIAQRLANAIVEGSNYKVLHEEAQEKLVEVQAQLEQAQEKLVEVQAQLEQAQAQLERINSVLDADDALKELFDEVAEKLEAEKLEKEK
ncbi:hypothetical protein [Streptococcus sp. 343_SSPC]|uniref:hypothetical protein n=1 Tax=Streptococcus sp. 343_SSPC TaxID=1579342 RepID=UPI0006617C4F|nr:hypothetical protein [Streptococcus sp. 343_SSPC]